MGFRKLRHSFFFGIIGQDDREQAMKGLVTESLLEGVKDLEDGAGGVVVADAAKQELGLGQEEGEEHLETVLATNDAVHLDHGSIWPVTGKGEEFGVGAAMTAGPVDFVFRLGAFDPAPDGKPEVEVSSRQPVIADEGVERALRAEQFIGMVEIDVVDRLAFLEERGHQKVGALEFRLGQKNAASGIFKSSHGLGVGFFGVIDVTFDGAVALL